MCQEFIGILKSTNIPLIICGPQVKKLCQVALRNESALSPFLLPRKRGQHFSWHSELLGAAGVGVYPLTVLVGLEDCPLYVHSDLPSHLLTFT